MKKLLLLLVLITLAMPVVAWPKWGGGGVSGTAAVSRSALTPKHGKSDMEAMRAARKKMKATPQQQATIRAAAKQRDAARDAAMKSCSKTVALAKTSAAMNAAMRACQEISKKADAADMAAAKKGE